MDTLYGRTEQLAGARLWLERALAGQGKLLLFTGEPGIGKSRLMEQLAREAAGRGAVVAWGRSWEAGGAPAYWPWMQVFRSLGTDGDPFAGITEDLVVGKAEARFAAFDRAVQWLLAAAAKSPLVIVLDDLHAADAPSLLLLLLLSRELPRVRLLVVAAYRDAELRTASEVAALLAKLAREADVMPLARLAPADVAAWLRDVAPEADAVRAEQLYRLTEGQPLFVIEALRLGAGSHGRTSWTHGPHALLDERLGRLSAPTRGVLEVAAVLGREFDRDHVAVVSRTSRDAVHEALTEALTASIVVPTSEAGRFRFSHVLLRDRLYHELLPSLREGLHFRAGTHAADGGDIQSAAHHLFESGGAAPFERVAEIALAAAEAALSRLAFEDAVRLSQRALRSHSPSQLTAAAEGALQIVQAEALIRLGDNATGQALCAEVAQRARASGQPLLLARAALAYATELVTGTVDPRMIELLRAALDALDPGDSPLRARLLARLCAALTPPTDCTITPEILTLMRSAIAMARRLGDQHSLLYVLQFAGTVGLLVEETERLALLEESLSLARALHQPLVLLYVMPPFITQLLAIGGHQQAAQLIPEYTGCIGESRQPTHRVRYLAVKALLATLRGEHEVAERLDEEGRTIAHGAGLVGPQFVWLTHRLSMAQLREDASLIERDATSLLTRLWHTPSTGQYYGWFLASMGRTDEARARLRATDLSEAGLAFPLLWELHAAAETCVLLRDVEFGERLYPHAVRAADRAFWTVGPGALVGPSSRALGDLALLLGRTDEARAHYERAVADAERIGAEWLALRCRHRVARLDAGAPQPSAASPASRPGRAVDRAPPLVLERDGDVWAIRWRGTTQRLKPVKGYAYLQRLIEQPGREIHVLELAGIEHRAGDAGPLLDPEAKAAYGARLAELRDEANEAERFGDRDRARRAEDEIEAIAQQLAAAVGLGGRDRRAAADVERVRINIQRRLKDAIDRVTALDPALGQYLAATVKTGTTCVFRPLS